MMTFKEFCTEADRIGLTLQKFAEQLAQRPEFADCLPINAEDFDLPEPALEVDGYFGYTESQMREVIRAALSRQPSAPASAVAVCENFEVRGPDADGLVWLHLRGNGSTGEGIVRIGAQERVVAQVALLLEADRRAALAAAKPEGGSRE